MRVELVRQALIDCEVPEQYRDAIIDRFVALGGDAGLLSPVGSTYTMQALVPGCHEVQHATLNVRLPAGTSLYAYVQPGPGSRREVTPGKRS